MGTSCGSAKYCASCVSASLTTEPTFLRSFAVKCFSSIIHAYFACGMCEYAIFMLRSVVPSTGGPITRCGAMQSFGTAHSRPRRLSLQLLTTSCLAISLHPRCCIDRPSHVAFGVVVDFHEEVPKGLTDGADAPSVYLRGVQEEAHVEANATGHALPSNLQPPRPEIRRHSDGRHPCNPCVLDGH